MKTEPTDLDREAARLFAPAPGMRALMADAGFCGEWVIICDVEPGLWAGERGKVCGWRRGSSTRFGDAWEAFGPCAEVLALDADDDATVGVMLAQVREASGDPYGFIAPWAADNRDIPVEWRYSRDPWFPDETCGPAASAPGAALVAAMRALKGKP